MTTTHIRSGLLGVLATAAAAALVLTALPTGAAYTDSAYSSTETLTANLRPEGLQTARSVDTGLGLGGDGNAYIWGMGLYCITGSTTTVDNAGPTKVKGLPNGDIVSVAGGIYDYNALDADGFVWGWGNQNNRNGTSAASSGCAPQKLRVGTAWNGSGPLLDEITSVVTTEMAGAAIRYDGTVYHWGQRAYGGNGGTTGATLMPGLPNAAADKGNRAAAIYGSYDTFWVVLNNGDIYHIGNGSSAPASDGASNGTARKSTALSAWFSNTVGEGKPHITQLSGGINMGQALLSDGRLITWGFDTNRAGRRTATDAQARIPGIHPYFSDLVSIRSGFTGMVALTSTGELHGFGANDDYGQLRAPRLVDTDVVQFVAGQGFYLWQKTNLQFWGLGYNPRGSIGLPIGTITSPRLISHDMSIVTK